MVYQNNSPDGPRFFVFFFFFSFEVLMMYVEGAPPSSWNDSSRHSYRHELGEVNQQIRRLSWSSTAGQSKNGGGSQHLGGKDIAANEGGIECKYAYPRLAKQLGALLIIQKSGAIREPLLKIQQPRPEDLIKFNCRESWVVIDWGSNDWLWSDFFKACFALNFNTKNSFLLIVTCEITTQQVIVQLSSWGCQFRSDFGNFL